MPDDLYQSIVDEVFGNTDSAQTPARSTPESPATSIDGESDPAEPLTGNSLRRETSNESAGFSPSEIPDALDMTDEELKQFLTTGGEYQPMAFADPIEMYGYFDRNLQEGNFTWNPWQVETGIFLAQKGYTKAERLRFLVVAANGSGKDAFVIAPFAVWHCLCKIRSRCVITSSSYTQLKNQTENYIRTLCNRINTVSAEQGLFPKPPFIIKKEHIVCRYTKSEIIMFSTDDPGRAEGYHPFPDYPQGELCIIINEAKTVPDDIFSALERCTYSRWIEISTPGHTAGHLYNSFQKSVAWRAGRPNYGYQRGRFFSRVVSAYDCHHIPREIIDQEKFELGEHSFAFRSRRLALFTSLGQRLVVTGEDLVKCITHPPIPQAIKGFTRRFGLDIGKGNDEVVLIGLEGNRIFCMECFTAKNFYEETAPIINRLLLKHGAVPEETEINADDGGVGGGLIDILQGQYHWVKINRVLNQSKVVVKGQGYGNRGAELWFSAARIIQECLIDLSALESLDTEKKFHSQVSNRHYKQHESQGTIILKSKEEERAEGIRSPDRADAFVLALAGLNIHDFKDGLDRPLTTKKVPVKNLMTQEQMLEFMDDRKYKIANGERSFTKSINPIRIIREYYSTDT